MSFGLVDCCAWAGANNDAETTGSTFFSPNRQVASPGVFGSLPTALGAARPMKDGAAGEMATAADQGQARRDLALVAGPAHDRLVGTHDPLAIIAVEVDRHAAAKEFD